MGKISRNAPCPCGSKNKFKNCCLPRGSGIAPIEFDIDWQELRMMEGKVTEGTQDFALEEGGKALFADGEKAFLLDAKSAISQEEEPFFLDWFIYRWIPSDFSKKWEKFGANNTLAESYVKKENNKKYIDFVNSVSKSPFSFFLVDDVIPSRRVVLKDLLLRNTVVVKERSAAERKFKGSVILARVVHHKGQAIFKGVAPFALSARYAMDILDLRGKLLQKTEDINPSFLLKHDSELRNSYFSLEESAYQVPKVTTKERDLVVFCTMYYKIECSPQKCFDLMSPLCTVRSRKELLKESVFDKNNELHSSQFPWMHKDGSNSVLGGIQIKGKSLVIDTNSIPRANAIRKEMTELLPEAIFVKLDTKKLEATDLRNFKQDKEFSSDLEDEILEAYYSDYYSKWVDMTIPLLDNKTPRQAAKTAIGREKVELLLLGMEQDKQQNRYIQKIRKELDLSKKEIEIY